MIDLHSHVLPGIDDGPETIEESVELARAAAAAGTSTLLATPHVSWGHLNDSQTIARGLEALRARLREEAIELDVRPGAELAMTRVADTPPAELGRLTLGGGQWILLEPPFTPMLAGLELVISDIERRGYRVLLAHPERCQAFHADRELLERIVASGVLTSITAGSIAGRFGSKVRRFTLELFHDDLVHNVASDAHDAVRRPPGVLAELEQAGIEPLSHWLTEAVPAAILEGGEIPARPQVEISARRGRRWLARKG